MKVLAFPRDPNPYQRLLYSEMERLGTQVRYMGTLTPSHTLNLLLLPGELAARRAMGAKLVHLHWVFAFGLPGSARFPFLRRIAHEWFLIWLRSCRVLGVRLVWTAHNVMPHAAVFDDDLSARRTLVKSSDLVVAHDQSTLVELSALGAVPKKSAVIPHGPLLLSKPADAYRIPGAGDGPRQALFFGRVLEYKGVEELLTAFIDIPEEVKAHLLVTGQCDDSQLRSRLEILAAKGGSRVSLLLKRIADADLSRLLAQADFVVLPFRRVTTSGSAILALGHARPLIVPNLASLANLPEEAVKRYDGTVPGLTAALDCMARASREVLASMSTAARSYAPGPAWQEVAARTISEMTSLLGDRGCSRVSSRPSVSARARRG
jgi:glycosyltransferase involved in cell wall biosynthesis